MAIEIKHQFVSGKVDSPDTTRVQPSNWNENHNLTLAAGKVLGRASGTPGAVQELPLEVDSTLQSVIPPSGTTAQRPASPLAGMFRFNTTLGKLEVYAGGAWGPVGGGATVNTVAPSSPQTGDFWYNPSSGILQIWNGAWVPVFGGFTTATFSGDGVQTAFTLPFDPGSENNTQVYVAGVYQAKATYTVVGTTLTFSAAPPNAAGNIEVMLGTVTPIGTPSDGTVTAAKINGGDAAAIRTAISAQQADPQLSQLAIPGVAGTVKMSDGTDYINYSLVGSRLVYMTPVENPAGSSGVGYDFDWPAPPTGEPVYDPSEITAFFFGTAPTATAQLIMQLKVDGVLITTGYVNSSGGGGGVTSGFALPSLNAGVSATGHSSILRMDREAVSRWVNNTGASGVTGRVDTGANWATGVSYTAGQKVRINGLSYLCATNHTSGVFATDLAAARWTLYTGRVTGIRIFQNGTTFNGAGALGCSIRG